MKSYNNSVLDKKRIKNFLSSIFSNIFIDLRSFQFLNYKIVDFVKKMIDVACKLAIHRKGTILRAKDVRYFIYQNYNFMPLGLNFIKSNKKKKTKKLKLQ
jgi:hypothetical protein